MNSIDAAIAQAQAQANQTPANVPATIDNQPGTAVGQTRPKMGLDDFMTGAMSVDTFLKVKDSGLRIGDNRTALETVRVSIDMSNDVDPCEAIKFGNPATYYKTFDYVTTANQGFSWEQAIAKARQVDPNARPYKSADIQMTVLEDIELDKDKTTIEAGTRLGHSLSTTNRANFQSFLKELGARGLMNETVEVEVGYQVRTNKAGNEWGVLTFKLLGALEN